MNADDVEARRQWVLMLRDRPEGVPPAEFARLLLKAMKDQNWRVRKTALEVLLENYPVESYIEGLMKLLYIEDNAGARNTAIEALVRLGGLVTAHLMDAFYSANSDVRKFIIDIVGETMDKKALPLLLGALKDEDENVRASAVEHLGSMKESSVVDVLIDILKEGDLWTAYPAAEALGKIGDKRAVPTLVEALSKRTLAEPTLRALGRIGDEGCLDVIVPMLADRSRAVQNEALCSIEMLYRRGRTEDTIVRAIEKHFGDGAVDLLTSHIKNPRIEVRAAAILLLGLLKDDRALAPLLDLVMEDEVVEDVRRALVYIGTENPQAVIGLFQQDNIDKLRFLCEVASEIARPELFETLCAMLENDDGHVRSTAAIGLANINDPRALDKLKGLLTDQYRDVQEAAVRALSLMKDHLDLGEVKNTMHSEDPLLRRNISILLGEIGTDIAVESLGFAMKDEEVDVRKAAVSSLSRSSSKQAFDLLLLALADEEPTVRGSAALALGSAGVMSAFEPVSLLLEDKSDLVKVASIKSLAGMGDPRGVSMLVEMLSYGNGFVVTAAMEALALLGGEEAKKALTSMLFSEDMEFKRTAIKGLSGFEDVERVILPFLMDGDWATRVAAVEALGSSDQRSVRGELERLYDIEDDEIVKKALDRYLNV